MGGSKTSKRTKNLASSQGTGSELSDPMNTPKKGKISDLADGGSRSKSDEEKVENVRSSVKSLANKVRQEVKNSKANNRIEYNDSSKDEFSDVEQLDKAIDGKELQSGVTTRSKNRGNKKLIFVELQQEKKVNSKRDSSSQTNEIESVETIQIDMNKLELSNKSKPEVSEKTKNVKPIVDAESGKSGGETTDASDDLSSSPSSSDTDSEYERRIKRKWGSKRKKRNKESRRVKRKRKDRSGSRSRSTRKAAKRRWREPSLSGSDTDDEFQRKVQAAVAEQLAKQQRRGGEFGETSERSGEKQNKTPLLDDATLHKECNDIHETPKGGRAETELIKSNSESTLYVPAVRKRIIPGSSSPSCIVKPGPMRSNNFSERQLNDILTQIRAYSIVVPDNMRKTKGGNVAPTGEIDDDDEMQLNIDERESGEQLHNDAKQLAEQAVANAEKYKASLNMQPSEYNTKTIDEIDDAFFHIACHVGSELEAKCAVGKHVELDKLLAKARLDRGGSDNHQKLDILHKEGQSFLVTNNEREIKVNGIKRWNQAFRIYAAIYSKKNPHRAAEIWQYVHVINTATVSYSWDNVAFYDTTFRRLMEANPTRNWARIYTQGWSLAMRDPIGSSHRWGSGESQRQRGDYNGSKSAGKRGTCWRFNKKTCKFGDKCRYAHECSYCYGKHPVTSCPKKKRNSSGSVAGSDEK